MSDQNNCNFTGRLGKDPEIRYAASGTAIANFSMAVGSKYKGEDKTVWLRCVAFGKLASDVIAKYLNKGDQVAVRAKFQENEWTDKEGNRRFSAEFIVDELTMLGGKGQSQGQNQPSQQPEQAPLAQNSMDDDLDVPF